ncbi:MAG: hypothetical protein WCI61_07650, partial [Chloroflexota bacterium]
MDLSVNLAPRHKVELLLRNPVMTASGTFSNGIEIGKHFDLGVLGAIISKGTTIQPRKGNPTPRTVETAAGMINAIGFQNIGVGALISTLCPVWERWDVPAIVNIMGYTLEEYGLLAARLLIAEIAESLCPEAGDIAGRVIGHAVFGDTDEASADGATRHILIVQGGLLNGAAGVGRERRVRRPDHLRAPGL